MIPVVVSTVRPGGRPVAPKLVGLLVAGIVYVKGTSVCPLTPPALVTTGGPIAMLNVTGLFPVPVALVALTVAAKLPTAVGVPEINPVAGFTVSPGGKPLAPKLV